MWSIQNRSAKKKTEDTTKHIQIHHPKNSPECSERIRRVSACPRHCETNRCHHPDVAWIAKGPAWHGDNWSTWSKKMSTTTTMTTMSTTTIMTTMTTNCLINYIDILITLTLDISPMLMEYTSAWN